MNLMHGDTWALVILSLRFMPGMVIVLPYFKMATFFNVIDTQIVLIVVYVAFGLPFAVWILRGFLLDLPKEIEEAARLDGLSWLQIIFRLIMPMAAPGIAVTAIFTFVFSWNEFLFALFLTSPVLVNSKTAIPFHKGRSAIHGAGRRFICARMATGCCGFSLVILFPAKEANEGSDRSLSGITL